MTDQYLSFNAYAVSRGLAVSTVSRAVSRGKLPTVTVAGVRMIDVAGADKVRTLRATRNTQHGGRPDRAVRKASAWLAKRNGFDPAVRAVLAVMVEDAPRLIADAMRAMGADDVNAVRATLAFREMTSHLAAYTFEEFNSAGIRNYNDALPEPPALDWPPEAQAELDRLRNWYDTPAGAEVYDDMAEAASRASAG